MHEDLVEELTHNWKRPNVNKVARANFLYDLMKTMNLTQTEFSNKFNIAISTLQGWLVYSKITEDKLEVLKESGIRSNVIHETLKKKKYEDFPEDNFIYDLNRCMGILKLYITNGVIQETGTAITLSKLKNIIDKLTRKIV